MEASGNASMAAQEAKILWALFSKPATMADPFVKEHPMEIIFQPLAS